MTQPLARIALAVALPFAFAALSHAQEPESAQTEPCDCAYAEPGAGQTFSLAFPHLFGGGARLGISLDADDATDSTGARVDDVLDDGPAAAAGLRAGDVITAIDGRSIAQRDADDAPPGQQLVRRLRGIQPGDTVRIDYRRDGQNLAANLITTEREPLYRARRIEIPPVDVDIPHGWPAESIGRALGFAHHQRLELADINEALGEYFDADRGVLVIDVHSDSRLGVEPGDVILRIGDREVRDARHARSILSSYRADEPVQIEITRNRQRETITGRAR